MIAPSRLSQNRTCGPRIRLFGSICQNSSTSWAETCGEFRPFHIALSEAIRSLNHILSFSERTVREWLRIFELWLACHTQEEIAEIVQRERVSATRGLENVQNGNLAELNKI